MLTQTHIYATPPPPHPTPNAPQWSCLLSTVLWQSLVVTTMMRSEVWGRSLILIDKDSPDIISTSQPASHKTLCVWGCVCVCVWVCDREEYRLCFSVKASVFLWLSGSACLCGCVQFCVSRAYHNKRVETDKIWGDFLTYVSVYTSMCVRVCCHVFVYSGDKAKLTQKRDRNILPWDSVNLFVRPHPPPGFTLPLSVSKNITFNRFWPCPNSCGVRYEKLILSQNMTNTGCKVLWLLLLCTKRLLRSDVQGITFLSWSTSAPKLHAFLWAVYAALAWEATLSHYIIQVLPPCASDVI